MKKMALFGYVKIVEIKMANLVYYKTERKVFKDAFSKELSVQTAEMVYKKLCKHYKIPPTGIEWTSGRNHPHAGFGITLNRDWNNFGILSHEFAHHLGRRRLGFDGHNKKHWRTMKKVINYCRRKKWWEGEFERRTAPKPDKPEPTKEALRQKKIEKLEQSTKRCLSKIKRYENLIKKNNRRMAHLKKFI